MLSGVVLLARARMGVIAAAPPRWRASPAAAPHPPPRHPPNRWAQRLPHPPRPCLLSQ